MYVRRLHGLWRYNRSKIRYTKGNTTVDIIVANIVTKPSNIGVLTTLTSEVMFHNAYTRASLAGLRGP